MAIIPAFVFGTVATYRAAEGQLSIAEIRLQDTARALALAVDRDISRTIVALQAFATSSVFRSSASDLDEERARSEARALARLLDATVDVIAPDGSIPITSASGAYASGPGVRSPEILARALETAGPVVGNVTRNDATDQWMISIAVPILGPGGRVALVVGASADVTMVRRLLASWDLRTAEFAALSDAQNVVVARSDHVHDQVVGRAIPPEGVRHISGRPGGLYRAPVVDGTERVIGFHAVPSLPGWTVIVASHVALVDGAWRRPFLTLLLGGCLALMCGIALSYASARTILRPTRSLAAQARLLAGGSLPSGPAFAERSSIAELAELQRGLEEAIAAAAARRHAEERAVDLAQSLSERTRSLAKVGVELQSEMSLRREAEEHMHQSQKLEALGQMTGSVVHDVNNVLTAIVACFRLIERRVGSDTAVKDILRQGDRAVDRASALVRQLLIFSRQETLRAEVIDLARLLPETCEMIRHTTGRHLTVSVATSPDLWPVLADPSLLEIALLNLALNARDAMRNEGTLDISARNRSKGEGTEDAAPSEQVVITVRDDGAGMSPEVLARAREPFFTTKPRGKGTGLGLSMVQRFAAQSNGGIRIESEPGKGTTVELFLPRAPLADVHATPMVAADRGAGSHPRADGTAVVLLVENDEQVRLLIGSLLTDLGYVVVDAASGEAAEAIFAEMRRLDVLIASVELSGVDAATLAARLRLRRPDLRVVFMTGSAPGPALAGEVVLRKPLAGAELAAAVSSAVGRRHRPGHAPAARLLRRLRSPALRAAYLAWHAARLPGENLPRLHRFRLDDLGLRDIAVVTEVTDDDAGEPTLRPDRVGPSLRARLSRDAEGMSTGSPGSPDGEDLPRSMADTCRRCARTAAPVHERERSDVADGVQERFERLLLPLSSDGSSVSHVVGIVLFGGRVAAGDGGRPSDGPVGNAEDH